MKNNVIRLSYLFYFIIILLNIGCNRNSEIIKRGRLTDDTVTLLYKFDNLKIGNEYSLTINDKFNPSEYEETAVVSMLILNKDRTKLSTYRGPDNGLWNSNTPGGIKIKALEDTIFVRVSSRTPETIGTFRVLLSKTVHIDDEKSRYEIIGGIETLLFGRISQRKKPTTKGVLLSGSNIINEDALLKLSELSGNGNCLYIASKQSATFSHIKGFSSIRYIILDTRDKAFSGVAVSFINNSDAIIIGDFNPDFDPVKLWRASPVIEAISNSALKRGVPVMGIGSASNLLGEYCYSVESATNYSLSDILDFPLNDSYSIEKDFIRMPGSEKMVVESYFHTRDRVAPFIGIMASIIKSKGESMLRGIALDNDAVLYIDSERNLKVMGDSAVFILVPFAGPELIEPYNPLTWQYGGKAVKVYSLYRDTTIDSESDTPISLKNISMLTPSHYYSVTGGVLSIGGIE